MALSNPALQNEHTQIVSQLEQAIYNHRQWLFSLIRTLLCRLPGNNDDILRDAHKRCHFGQWYAAILPEIIQRHPEFIPIGKSHKHLHHLARKLLLEADSQEGIKPLDYDCFSKAIEQMQTEMSNLKNKLEYLLYSLDPLTGAINRISMLPTLREQQALIKRQNQHCCIAMVDLDLFKKVNDHYGHKTGDTVLTAITHYLIRNLRSYDKVFRYGGEEFLLYLPFTELSHGQKMVERLQKGIAAMPIHISDQTLIHITISIGIALLDPDDPIEESIEHADKAMYAAKSAGRNCVHIWG